MKTEIPYRQPGRDLLDQAQEFYLAGSTHATGVACAEYVNSLDPFLGAFERCPLLAMMLALCELDDQWSHQEYNYDDRTFFRINPDSSILVMLKEHSDDIRWWEVRSILLWRCPITGTGQWYAIRDKQEALLLRAFDQGFVEWDAITAFAYYGRGLDD